MNGRTLIILTLAIGCGLATVVGVKQMQSGGDGTTEAAVETVGVVVSTVDLPVLHVVEEADVTLAPWPKNLVPAGAMTSIEEVTGKTLRQSKKTNQPIFQSDLDTGRGIDVLIPDDKNMRLVTILTPSEAANVAGLVQPGDHVDVTLILTSSGRERLISPTGGAHARMLMQNVLVISTGQQVEIAEGNEEPAPYQSVTLAVTVDQSLILQLAQTKGTLTLALRETGDTEIVDVNPFTLAELRELDSFSHQNVAAKPEVAATEAPEPAMKMVDVYRRIRTYRGTTPGEVLLRTQELRRVAPVEMETDRLNAGLPSRIGARTP